MQPQYRRADRVVWRHASGGVLVLPVTSGAMTKLSGTGEDLWEVLRQPHTVAALAQRLAEHYGAPRSTVTAELTPVLDDLIHRGVLERTEQP